MTSAVLLAQPPSAEVAPAELAHSHKLLAGASMLKCRMGVPVV